MKFHEVCRECVLSGDCLFQSNGDVDMCEEYREWEIDNEKEK